MYDDLAPSGDLLRERAAPDDAGALRLRRVRDLGDVINATFRLLRDNLGELGLGLVLVVGPAALLAAMLSAWAQLQMEMATFDPADPTSAFGSSGYVIGFAASAVAAVVVQLLIQSTVLGYLERYRRGEAGTVTPQRLWEATKKAFGPVLSTTAIAIGLLLTGFLAFTMLAAVTGVVGILVMLGALAGMVYLAPILSMLYVVRVAEGEGFWDGFERARDLVRGQWGPTFGVIFVATLLAVAIMLVLSIPGAVVQAAFSFNTLEGGGPLRVVAIAVAALFGVVAYAAYVVPVVAAAVQYFNLVERKEGAGLMADLDALQARPSPPAPQPAVPVPLWRPEPEAEAPPAGTGFRGGGFDDEGGGRAG
jgi:hypothetical protein